MAIYRGPGGPGDAVADAASEAALISALVTQAQTAEANAGSSASAASVSASSAATSASNAASSASTASTAASNAASSASAASTSASNAASSASAASTSASNAASSASNASASESAASTSASNAAASASAASTSASNAASSASAAATSANNAAASYDSFDDRYLGAKSSAPTLDNDGNALLTGALYWNTVGNQLYVWNGSAWDAAAFNVSGALTTSDIGVTVQAYDADTAKYDDTIANFTGTLQNGGHTVLTNASDYLDSADIGVTVQAYDVDTAKLDVSQTWAANQNFADYFVQRATLKDYAVEGSAVGNTGSTETFDLTNANFFSATLDQACTFTFSNPPASGDFGTFVLELTNGGAFTITWPTSVDWVGGAAPTLTSSGKDQLVFTTRDGGTTWFGFVAGLDIK